MKIFAFKHVFYPNLIVREDAFCGKYKLNLKRHNLVNVVILNLSSSKCHTGLVQD